VALEDRVNQPTQTSDGSRSSDIALVIQGGETFNKWQNLIAKSAPVWYYDDAIFKPTVLFDRSWQN